MALYSVEILEPISHPKAIALISGLAGLGRAETRRRLRRLPMTVQASVPLAEAVSMQRQLHRVGVNARVVRMEVGVEDGDFSGSTAPAQTGPREEIIEIPDGEVRILEARGPQPEKGSIKKRKRSRRAGRKMLGLLIGLAGLILLAYWYVEIFGRSKSIQADLAASIETWSRTLNEQEAALDRGITAQQIFNRLLEIENKINTLLRMLKSPKTVAAYAARYATARERLQDAMLDLDFRRSLENAGYPLHPTCLVDQGMVRGSSELPEGTVLRVQLLGGGVEATAYAAQIHDGIFQMVIDPALEGGVYDARCTVAGFSQQPQAVQQWAFENLALPGPSRAAQPVPMASSGIAGPTRTARPEEDSANQQSRKIPAQPLISKATAGTTVADSSPAASVNKALYEWEQTIRIAEKKIGSSESYSLEDIYQKLLSIEARIDQLIELISSDPERDSSRVARNELWGAYRSLRQELQRRHQEFLSENSPYILEGRIRRSLQSRGLAQVQVLVLDSPTLTDAFVIDIEAASGNRDHLAIFPGMAQTLQEEISRVPFRIEAIRFQESGRRLIWTPEVIKQAAAALEQPDGQRRCAEILETNGSVPAKP